MQAFQHQVLFLLASSAVTSAQVSSPAIADVPSVVTITVSTCYDPGLASAPFSVVGNSTIPASPATVSVSTLVSTVTTTREVIATSYIPTTIDGTPTTVVSVSTETSVSTSTASETITTTVSDTPSPSPATFNLFVGPPQLIEDDLVEQYLADVYWLSTYDGKLVVTPYSQAESTTFQLSTDGVLFNEDLSSFAGQDIGVYFETVMIFDSYLIGDARVAPFVCTMGPKVGKLISRLDCSNGNDVMQVAPGSPSVGDDGTPYLDVYAGSTVSEGAEQFWFYAATGLVVDPESETTDPIPSGAFQILAGIDDPSLDEEGRFFLSVQDNILAMTLLNQSAAPTFQLGADGSLITDSGFIVAQPGGSSFDEMYAATGSDLVNNDLVKFVCTVGPALGDVEYMLRCSKPNSYFQYQSPSNQLTARNDQTVSYPIFAGNKLGDGYIPLTLVASFGELPPKGSTGTDPSDPSNPTTDTTTTSAPDSTTATDSSTSTDIDSNTTTETEPNTATDTNSDTATGTDSNTATETDPSTATDTDSSTPSDTDSNTLTETDTSTPTETDTNTPTDTDTTIPTETDPGEPPIETDSSTPDGPITATSDPSTQTADNISPAPTDTDTDTATPAAAPTGPFRMAVSPASPSDTSLPWPLLVSNYANTMVMTEDGPDSATIFQLMQAGPGQYFFTTDGLVATQSGGTAFGNINLKTITELGASDMVFACTFGTAIVENFVYPLTCSDGNPIFQWQPGSNGYEGPSGDGLEYYGIYAGSSVIGEWSQVELVAVFGDLGTPDKRDLEAVLGKRDGSALKSVLANAFVF